MNTLNTTRRIFAAVAALCITLSVFGSIASRPSLTQAWATLPTQIAMADQQ